MALSFDTDSSPAVADTDFRAPLGNDIAALSGGGFVVIFEGTMERGFGPKDELRFQLFDAAGNTVGPNVTIVQEISNAPAHSAEVVGLAGGGFAVAYRGSENTDFAANNHFVNVYTADGLIVGTQLIGPPTVAAQSAHSLVATSDGGFAAAWMIGRGTTENRELDVVAQRFNADGSANGDLIEVVDLFLDNQTKPFVTELTNGQLLVSWVTNASEGVALRVARVGDLDGGGTVVSPSQVVLTIRRFDFVDTPVLVALDDDGFGVITMRETPAPDDPAFRSNWPVLHVFDKDGAAVGAAQVLGDPEPRSAGVESVDVAQVPGGGFVAVWEDRFNIVAQRYDGSGVRMGDMVRLSDIADTSFVIEGLIYGPDVAVSGDGSVAVAAIRDLSLTEADVIVRVGAIVDDPENGGPGDGELQRVTVILADQTGQPIAETAVTFRPDAGTETTVASDPDGLVQFDLSAGQEGIIEVTRAYSLAAGDPAITANDALDVLRMAVGLNPSFGPAAARNFIAADIDSDGRVTAADALEILRSAVGLESENAPRWVFLDAETDWDSVVQDGVVSYQEGIEVGALTDVADLGLTGILLGNVAEVV